MDGCWNSKQQHQLQRKNQINDLDIHPFSPMSVHTNFVTFSLLRIRFVGEDEFFSVRSVVYGCFVCVYLIFFLFVVVVSSPPTSRGLNSRYSTFFRVCACVHDRNTHNNNNNKSQRLYGDLMGVVL